MAGRYEIDGSLFVENPIIKSYSRDTLGIRGDGTPALSPVWTLEFEYSTLLVASGSQTDYIYNNWQAGGEHAVKIPHPLTGQLTTFSGVNISTDGWALVDIDRDRWGTDIKMIIRNIDTSMAW